MLKPGKSSQTGAHVWRVEAGRVEAAPDQLATEEPLEIRLRSGGASRTVALTMRTPGADVELAAGFLFAEGIVTRREQVVRIVPGPAPSGDGRDEPAPARTVAHAAGIVGTTASAAIAANAAAAAVTNAAASAAVADTADTDTATDDATGAAVSTAANEIEVELEAGLEPDLAPLERHFFATSACGVCGKAGLANLRLRIDGEIPAGPVIEPAVLYALPARLREAQGIFTATGGLHAAALFDPAGELLAVREDVGRHNALDKLIGWAFLGGRLPLHEHIVLVSGRSSYEILQKCASAGVPVVCAVSAPSSLAVELAERFGITLVGFLRGGRCNVYAGVERIAGAPVRRASRRLATLRV